MGERLSSGDALKDISKIKWHELDAQARALARWGKTLRKRYGYSVGLNVGRPERTLGPHEPSPFDLYQDPRCITDNGSTHTVRDTRYTLHFSNGQTVSVTIADDGEIIERSYTDRGDVHFDRVVEVMRGWQKSIEQARRGGRKKQCGVSLRPTKRQAELAKQFWKSVLSQREFCRKKGIGRETLRRAIIACKKAPNNS